MRVLMLTSEYPSVERPYDTPFIEQEVRFLRRAGIEVDVFHYRGGKDWKSYLALYPEVRSKLKAEKYDLVHAQFGQSGLFALPKFLPLVVTFRGSDVLGIIDDKTGKYTLKGRILQLISRQVARYADQAIVVSKRMLKHLPERHYEIIPSGIDLDRFQPISQQEARLRLGLQLNNRIVFFGANPRVLRKRFALAKSAVELVRPQYPNVQLIPAVGIPAIDMSLYINAADVLILTSIHEGSPNIVKETLACNVPVVSVDVGDVRERIGNIDGCHICDSDEPAIIASALKEVLFKNQRIAGREKVLDLDQNHLIEKVIAAYQNAATFA